MDMNRRKFLTSVSAVALLAATPVSLVITGVGQQATWEDAYNDFIVFGSMVEFHHNDGTVTPMRLQDILI